MKKMYKILTLLAVVILSASTSFGQLTTSFSYTGGIQTYTVPLGVDYVTLHVEGAMGGRNGDSTAHNNFQGHGGCATANYIVTPGQVTYVFVGGKGDNGALNSSTAPGRGVGGFNGGGNGKSLTGSVGGGGGGGASDVRFGGAALSNRVIIAGGGGGAGSGVCAPLAESGGDGGGSAGVAGVGTCSALGSPAYGGGGGTSSTGGAHGTCTTCTGGVPADGALGVGGDGGSGMPSGGGGGGYYGGGGGRYTGGGGGSGYTGIGTSVTGFGSGCNSSQTGGLATITVHCATQVITATRTTICPYETLTLSDNISGGTWSTLDASIATVNASTGVVSGTTPGTTVSRTVMIVYNVGPCADTQTITVKPLPQPITGNTAVCSGLTSQLTDATSGGTWTSSGIPLVSSTGVLSGSTAGTGTVTYTSPTSGCYVTAGTTVNPLPAAITGTFQVCSGLNVTLSDATPLGTWSSSNSSIAAIDPSTGVVTGNTAGNDPNLITYTISATGCIQTHSFTVNPLPLPIVGALELCRLSSSTLSDGTPAGTWSTTGGSISINSTTGLVTSTTTGTQTVTYTITSTGCISTAVVTVDALPVVHTLSSGGHYCQGTAGVDINLLSNTAGVQYDLYQGSTVVATMIGTGTPPLDFGVFTAGTYSVVATDLSLPTKCTSNMFGTATIIMDPLPSAISGASGVCAGATTTLSDVGGGTWTSSNTAVATINSSGVVTGVALVKGSSTITYTLSTGCYITKAIDVHANYPIYGTTFVGCLGDILTVFDSSDAPAGGDWSITAGFTVFPATGSTTTDVNRTGGLSTAVLTYTSPFGCKATQTVTINPLTSNGGPSVVCEGATIQLTNSNLGGTWSSLNTNIATVDGTGKVTGVSATTGGGVVQINYTLSTGCTAGTIVTVNPTPAAIAGGNKVCQGVTLGLSDALSGGSWSAPCTSVLTIDPTLGIVTGANAGTCIISYTMPGTGCKATETFTVNPLPLTILGNLAICENYGTVLSDASGGGTWSSSNTLIATIGTGNGIVTAVTAGSADISYVLPTGCFTISTIVVFPNPAAISIVTGTDTLCGGSSITVSDATPLGTWSTKSLGVISSAVSPPGSILASTTSGGVDSIIYKTLAGCVATKGIYVRALGPIAGPGKMCVGSTSLFTELGTGGTWSSSVTTVATVDASGNVLAVSPGVTVIMDTFATGCYATTTLTVYPMPVAITAATFNVCNNSTITLTDGTGGGTWSATGDATVNSGTGVVTGNNPLGGTATITYTVTISGCTATAVVTVYPLAPITGPSSVCYGSSVTLSDGTGGGTWSSSSTTIALIGTSSGIVNTGTNVNGGTVVMSYTTAQGCTATKSFTVNPVGIITPDRVCVGSSVTLSDAVGPGTWSSSNTNITLGSSTGLVTGVTAGTSVVSYTITSTGCSTAILFITDALPTAMTGAPFELCQGSTLTLSDADAGGTWISSSIPVGTIGSNSGIVTGISGGTTTITYKFSATGCQTTHVVTVDAKAPITGTLGVCVGLTTTLSDAIGFGTGTWSDACTTIYTVGNTNGTVTGVSAGSCTITYTNPKGCISTATVVVNPLPGAINGSTYAVCKGSSITLTDLTAGGTWSSSNSDISLLPTSGTTTVATGVTVGTTTLTYTSGLGCYSTHIITVNPISNILGSSQVCSGLSITLSDATGGGTWSTTATIISVNSSGVVTSGGTAGTGTVTYTITSTGCLATLLVTVNPLPAVINGPSVVCAGSSIVLTDATSGGAWTFSPPVSIILVSATTTATVTGVSGVSTITYTLPTTCIATHVVTVNPVPGPITGNNIICAGIGNSTTLSDATGGGTWSSVNTGVATAGSGTGVVTSTGVVGTTTISYTLSSTGCAATRIVSVTPFPTLITGPSTVCAKSTITLSDAATGGTWSSLNTTIADLQPPGSRIVLGKAAGTATIDYVLPTGCSTTFTVTVQPQPLAVITPLGSTNICPGAFVALTANTGPKLTYQWYIDPALSMISGETNASYIAMPTLTTNYVVAVVDSNGCSDTSALITVTTLPATATISALPSSGVVCAGTSLVLTASGTGATGYQWEKSGTPISGATAITYTPTVSGTYDAVVTNSNGCSATSATITVTINPVPTGTITVTGSTIFCAGDSVKLSGESGTGLTYQWYNSTGAVMGATNMDYEAKASETYSVTVTNTYGCSEVSGSVVVNTNPLPSGLTLTSSGEIFCSGAGDTFKVSSVNVYTYQWYDNGLPIGIAGGTFIALTSGRYKALATDPATGCTAFSKEDTAVLITAPVVVPLTSASFCWGGSAALKANIVGGITPTYQWYLNGTPITGGTSAVYSAITGGNYTVKITSACSMTSLAVTVKENPLPDPIVKFDGAHLYTSYGGYVSYQWYKDLVSIIGGTHSNIVPSTNGKYKVSVTDTNGCQSISDEYILTGWTPHYNEVKTPLAQGEIRIYPNPAQETLHVASNDELRAVITAIDGRLLIQQADAKEINIKNLVDGVYTIMLYDNSGHMVKADKFVKATE